MRMKALQVRGGQAHSRARLLVLADRRALGHRAALRNRPVLLPARTAASLARAGPVRPAAAVQAPQACLQWKALHMARLQRGQSSSSPQHCRRLLRRGMQPMCLAQQKSHPSHQLLQQSSRLSSQVRTTTAAKQASMMWRQMAPILRLPSSLLRRVKGSPQRVLLSLQHGRQRLALRPRPAGSMWRMQHC
jgi:hypothetical protein